jgi:hypothetical protein
MHDACLDRLIFLDFITLILFCELEIMKLLIKQLPPAPYYYLLPPSSKYSLQNPALKQLQYMNIPEGREADQVSHPYETSKEITVPCISSQQDG